MAFTGKATYSAGSTLPEIADDVSDLIGIISPHETPLLDLIGDSTRVAHSTVHEWLEDSLIANTDVVDDDTIADPLGDSQFTMTNADRFRPGDMVRKKDGAGEVMLVNSVSSDSIIVMRGYAGTTPDSIADGDEFIIIGNAALEGDDAPSPRFTSRSRKQNYTQIFTSTVEVSGSELAVSKLAVEDELDYQKTLRLRELLRDLENTVINGTKASANPEGSPAVRRSMQGVLNMLSTNVFTVGAGGSGGFTGFTSLTEDCLNLALRRVWENSSGSVDTILVGGFQKRKINSFIDATARYYTSRSDTVLDHVAVYESDFGVCNVVLCRWVPPDAAILLDRSRVSVMPLAGRSFQYVPLATTGDRQSGQVLGEYTLELRNEAAHGVIRGLSMA